MSRSILPAGCLAVLVLVASADSATAQISSAARAARVDRASSPSSRVGGTFTHESVRSLSAPQRDVALLGGDQFEFTRSARNRRRGAYSNILPVGEQGLSGVLAAPRGTPLTAQLNRTGEVWALSGIGMAQSLDLPLPGFPTGGLPAANAYLFTPTPERSPHAEFFKLTPVSDTPATPAEPVQSYAAALEERTQWRVSVAERDGLAAFKAGTIELRDMTTGRYANCQTCDAALVRANQHLQMVRALNGESWIAPLLLAHIALDRDRPSLASVYVVEAFHRHPELIAEGAVSLHQYFGDVGADGRSPFLQAQVRRYVRLGDLNPGSADAAVVEMYCAWQLGDSGRIRDCLQRFTGIAANQRANNPDVSTFMEAVRATVP